MLALSRNDPTLSKKQMACFSYRLDMQHFFLRGTQAVGHFYSYEPPFPIKPECTISESPDYEDFSLRSNRTYWADTVSYS